MNNKNKEIKQLFIDITNKKIKSFEPLKGGYSNETYLINDAYVLKCPKQFVQPFIDYQNEHNILLALFETKGVERCYFYDYEKGIKISKFCHGVKPYGESLLDHQIVLVAKFLKALHKKKDISCNQFDPILRIQVYKELAKTKIDGRYERKIINRIDKIIAKEGLVLCHNDVVKGNLLFGYDKLFVIDWEMAGLNSLYFDLASFISENNLNKDQSLLFLKTYFGSTLSNLKIKKVIAFLEFEDILWYYWAEMMAANCDEEIYKIIAKEKLEHIHKNMTQAHNELLD